jgi:hypothetical protein
MKLVRTRITSFKSIDDSTTVEVDPAITVLVGQNEAGKTAFLQAVHKAHAADDAKYDVTEEYPRKGLTEYRKRHESTPAPVSELTYRLDASEAARIEEDLGVKVPADFEFTRTANYANGSFVGGMEVFNEKAFIQGLLRGVDLPAETAAAAKATNRVRDLISGLEKADLNAEAQEFLTGLKSRFGGVVKGWSSALGWHIWTKHVGPRLPKSLYFDDYHLLPGKANLATLRTRVRQETLTAQDRTVLALLGMAGIDLAELHSDQGYEEVKANLEALSNTITDQIFEYWTQNQELAVEFDVREDPADDPPFNSGPNLYIRIRNQRHRVTVPFSQRSRGFIWFFSFLVWFDSVKKQLDTNRDLILLLDEPGLNLHALAQADLLRYLDDLTVRHQVLYTTHSPFMVQGDRLNQVRLVEDRAREGTKITSNVGGSDPRTLFPLQAALGYTIAQNLFISKRNLLVEGPADLVYLRFFSARLDAADRTGLRDDVTIVPVGGLDKVATFVALLGANELELAVLHDHAGKPDARLESVVREKLVREKQVLNYGAFRDGKKPSGKAGGAVTLPATDVEDLISPDLYLKLFNGAFKDNLRGQVIAESDLSAGDRIVDRINRYLASKKILVRPSGGFNHYAVANYLAGNPPKRIDAATLTRFEALFSTVNALFGV